MKLITTFVITAMLTVSAAAAPAFEYGAGIAAKCSDWTANTDNEGRPKTDLGLQLEAWYQGYVTAISVHPNTERLRETNRAEMYSFVEGYCRTAPNALLIDATKALVRWLAGGVAA